MFYRINIEGGYIHGVVKGVGEANANCNEEEYNTIREMLLNAPETEEGFVYRLSENMEWEKCALPEEEAEDAEDAEDAGSQAGGEV